MKFTDIVQLRAWLLFVVIAWVTAIVRADVDDVCRSWLRRQGLRQGWNADSKIMIQVGNSSFDMTKAMSTGDFLSARDGALEAAFRQMLRELMLSFRHYALANSLESVSDAVVKSDLKMGEAKKSAENILRPWIEETAPRFVWRAKHCDEMSEQKFRESTNTLDFSEIRKRYRGNINGRLELQYFEEWDEESGLYEVSVVGARDFSMTDNLTQSFESGVGLKSVRGNCSFDVWFANQTVDSLQGVRSYVDNEGKLWAVGGAPVIDGDVESAKSNARTWAAFAFGAAMEIEEIAMSNRSSWTGFGCREVFDARNTVVGTVYPEALASYKVVEGRHGVTGRRISVVVCILKSGTRSFRNKEFEKMLEDKVKADFIEGKRRSFETAKMVVSSKLEKLQGPENERKRKALLELLEKLRKELDGIGVDKVPAR